MNILLFSESFGDDTLELNPHPLMPGIFRLATHLRNQGYSVITRPIWRCHLTEFRKIIFQFSKEDINIIGISSTLLYKLPLEEDSVDDFSQRIKIIKDILPTAKIIVGGSLIRSYQFDNLKTIFSQVDFFVKGQGETAFDAIIKDIKKEQKIITSLLIPKTVSDEVYKFSDFDTSTVEYNTNDFINKSDSVGIEYSRGCIFKCSFCNYPGIGKKPGEFIKDKKTLRSELIKNYENYGIQYYYFTDDLLNETVRKMEDLAEVSASLPFDFKYSAYIRLDLIHRWPVMADLMKYSGMIAGHAGIETINDPSGKIVAKGLGKVRINETLDICNKSWNKKIGLAGSFILGLPHDTKDTVHDLLEWLDEPLTKTTLTDFNITALRLASEEMSSNPKYKYIWDKNKITGWVNQTGYGYTQANIDANYALKKFYKKYKIPVRFSGFDLPQLLSYAKFHNCESEMLNFYFNRTQSNFVNSSEDWYRLRLKWYRHRRTQYFENFLK